jgi:PKD repeat protein
MERKNIILIIVILLVAGGIFAVKRFMGADSGCPKLTYTISSNNILAGETIHFEDNTADANEWMWEFGDGGTSDAQSGEYTYKSAGEYTITLKINGKCSETASIKVAELNISSNDTAQKTVEIRGPASCMVGESVQFGNNTPGATKWEWQFGESGSNDKFEQNPSYTYESPGSYTVVLRVDASKTEGRHKITVSPKPAASASSGGGAPAPKLSGAELKAKFESITKGNIENVYNNMLKAYFCNNNQAEVVINGEKKSTIYSYCNKLDFQRTIQIIDVKVEYNSAAGCISKVMVTQK